MNMQQSASAREVPELTDPAMAAGSDPTGAPPSGGTTPASAGRDLIVGLVAVVLGLAYLLAIGSQVSAETDGLDGVSGQTLPHLIGGVLTFLGAALTVQALLRRRAEKASGQATMQAGEDWSRWRRAAMMVGLVACYWLGVTYIGYVVATAAALLAAMLFSGARNWKPMLILVLVVPPLMYWVFHELMYIPLPEALLF